MCNREIRSLNFIANCSEADFSNLKLALLAKPTISAKNPQFMFSLSTQQMIITSTKHQFRDTEFAGTPVSFQPIHGKMEQNVPNFSSFKAVAAAGIGPKYSMSNRSDRDIRSLNFIANCSEADFSNLKLALLAKSSIYNKNPQFMFSKTEQQLIITSSTYQFRDTEFANISLSATPVLFQPIFGKMEQNVLNFLSFKAVANAALAPVDAQPVDPEHYKNTKQSEGASDTDCEHDADIAGAVTSAGPGMLIFCDWACAWPCLFCCFSMNMLDMLLVPKLFFCMPLPTIYIPSDVRTCVSTGVRQGPGKTMKNFSSRKRPCPIKSASISPACVSAAGPVSAANSSSLLAASAVIACDVGAATKAECVQRLLVKGSRLQCQASKKKLVKRKSGPRKTIAKKKNRGVDPEIKKVFRINCTVKRCSGGGAHGGLVGINGSIRPTGMVRINRALKVRGSAFIDFGASEGRAVLAAMAGGASKADGYELPANKAHKLIFDAVCKELHSENEVLSSGRINYSCAKWHARNIHEIGRIEVGTHCAFSFWVGMPFETQECILSLCAKCPTIRAIAVFRDQKWPKPIDGPPALFTPTLAF